MSANFTPEQKKYNYLPPFKGWVLENFPFIEADFDAMTNYQMMCKIIEYLKNVQDNAVKTSINQEKLYEAFVKLQDYVNTYFDNLDLRGILEDILDDMAKSGDLEKLIMTYLNTLLEAQGMLTFDSIADLIKSTQVQKGNYVKVLGLLAKNDGGGGLYKIEETGESNNYYSILLDNGLYAILINNTENNFYNLKYVKERHYDTDCYITTIPKNDEYNNIINPYVAKYEYKGQTPLKYAQDNNTSLTINGSLGIKIDGVLEEPIIIGNGTILNDNPLIGKDVADNFLYLGFTKDREVKEYKVNSTSATMMLNDGCINVLNIYYKLINNYEKLDLSNVVTNEPNVVTDKHPRQAIGLKEDGTLIIITTDGRTTINKGLTSAELQQLFLDNMCIEAWNLDGGGSTNLTINCSKINRNIDGNGTVDRMIPYTLNVSKTITNKNIANSYSQAGIDKQQLIEQIIPAIAQPEVLAGVDLNTCVGKLYIAYANNCSNRPGGETGGYFINIPHPNWEYQDSYNTQIYFNRNSNNIYTRRQINTLVEGVYVGVFNEWLNVTNANKVDIRQFEMNQINNIQTENTYQPLNFIDTGGYNNNTNIVLKKVNESDEYYKYINIHNHKEGFAKITVEGNWISTTAGRKYIKIMKNDSGVVVQNSFNCGEGEAFAFNIQSMCYVNDDNTNFSVEIYGQHGDALARVQVIVEAQNLHE